jgi:hypothetical protein
VPTVVVPAAAFPPSAAPLAVPLAWIFLGRPGRSAMGRH